LSQAIIAVEPFSVLELVVGSGGGAGTCGTELQTVDIHEQRRRMALRRDKEIHLAKGEKMVHDDADEYAVALLVEESCGTTPGGLPGGKFSTTVCLRSVSKSREGGVHECGVLVEVISQLVIV
jgi:hypothetical protein